MKKNCRQYKNIVLPENWNTKEGKTMKTIKLSMVAIAAMATVSASNAQSLQEALTSGKLTGDVSVTYETRNVDKKLNAYYQDTAYSVGSIGLEYTTGTYNNFSAAVGMRAYNILWEDDKKSVTSHGTGDASERFYDEAGKVMLSKAYLAYDLNDIHVKAGRQPFYTEWVGKIQDAVSVYAKPFENAQLEAIWTKRMGRVYAREFRPFNDVNGSKGLYKAGLEYTFNDNVKTKGYYITAPDAFDLIGGKVTLDTKLTDGNIGTMIHMMQTDEDNGNADGKLLEVKLYGNYAGYSATLGYVQTGEENGWGSANAAGETVVQFEEGDGMYYADSETIYFSLNKKFGPVSLTALYGEMEYTKENYKEKEFDLWAGYAITNNLTMKLGLAVTNTDDKDVKTTDLTQLNTTFVYSF